MFGLGYIALTAAIWLQTRSRAALVALPALVATVALWWFAVPDAGAYSSAAWCLAGGWLMRQGFTVGGIPKNSEVISGAFYGISGLVYVLFYLGFSHETLAAVPIISDIAFGLGLFVGTWPSALAGLRRGSGRSIRRNAVEIARADLAGVALRDRGQV